MTTIEIPDNLKSLFTAAVDERDGSYVVELPETEITHGELQPDATYRIAVLPTASPDQAATSTDEATQHDHESNPGQTSGPPVEEGETRTVTIEDLGDQGDGIARVERGYVIIVPDTNEGDTVTVGITHVRDNVAFAEVSDSATETEATQVS